MPTPMIVDTDTASDDAVALIMALREPAVEVVAITVVAGNVPLAQASRNARYTVELCGAAVPVHEGADRPLAREPHTATFFHGEDGLGDRGYPPPRRPPAPGHAVCALVESDPRPPGPPLVTLGPLTNVALALAEAPDIASKVGRCVVMGGRRLHRRERHPGRRVQRLVRPRGRAGLLPLRPAHRDGGLGALPRRRPYLDDADIARCRALGTERARFAVDCNATALEVNRSPLPRPRDQPARPGGDGRRPRPRRRHAQEPARGRRGVRRDPDEGHDRRGPARRRAPGLADVAGWRPRRASRGAERHRLLGDRRPPVQGAALPRPRLRALRPSPSPRARPGPRPRGRSGRARRLEPHVRALLLEPLAQEHEPALQVVAEGGKPQRGVEPQLAVRELRAPLAQELRRAASRGSSRARCG